MAGPEFRAGWEVLEPERRITESIIECMERTGITEEQLAKRSGIGLAYLRRLENGTANPSLRTLKRLAAGMGMTIKLEFVPARPVGQ